jgi:hypothetical protein
MLIEIHDQALRGVNMTEAEALLHLAVGLFTERRATSAREILRRLETEAAFRISCPVLAEALRRAGE